MGGSDDPSNLELLTVEEHAEKHRILFEKYGHWEDEIAWKGLSGQIGKEEIIRRVLSEAGKKGGKIASGSWSHINNSSDYVNPMQNKSHKDSSKLLISKKRKDFYMSGGKNPMAGVTPKVKGWHWYNDGETEVMAASCPTNFVSGRLPKSKDTIAKISKSLIGNTRKRDYHETH